jgi:hypothetical protein
MKIKTLLFLAAFLCLSIASFGQAARFDSQAWTTGTILANTGVVKTVPSASITVCTYPAATFGACTKVPLCTDSTMASCSTGSNPVTADSSGNFGFWVAPGKYDYWITAFAANTGPYHIVAAPDVCAINGEYVTGTSCYANVQAALTAATTSGLVSIPSTYAGVDTYTNATPTSTAAANVFDFRSSTVKAQQPALYWRRVNNTAPQSGYGILNAYLDPMVRLDLVSQSGLVTGSHTGLLLFMPSLKGLELTTTTQVITGSGSPQTVSVANAAVFSIGDTATIDLNQGSSVTDFVTLTGVNTGGNTITGVFTHNHVSGAKIFVPTKGDKIGLGIGISDQAGNTDNIFGENLNITAVATGPHWYIDSEMDVTNSMGIEPGNFPGDVNPFIAGLTIDNAGANNSSSGLLIATANGSKQFLNEIVLQSGKNNGIEIDSGPNGAATNGINIYNTATNGIIIGSNQTAPVNPAFGSGDPSNAALFITARKALEGTVNATSGKIKLESLSSSVAHNFTIQQQEGAGGLFFTHDAVANGMGTAAAVGTDESFNNPVAYNLRNSSGSIQAQFSISTNAATLAAVNGGTLAVNATTASVSSGVSADGGGLKHKRVTGCTTGATSGNTCTTIVTWTTTFADANYTPVCMLLGPATLGHLAAISTDVIAAASVKVETVTDTNAAITGTINCIAVHD